MSASSFPDITIQKPGQIRAKSKVELTNLTDAPYYNAFILSLSTFLGSFM